MKKKLLGVFGLLALTCAVFGLSACDFGGDSTGGTGGVTPPATETPSSGSEGENAGEGEESSAHEHTFKNEYSTDMHFHWHASTCEHADEVSEKSYHNFGEDYVCTDCSYRLPITEGLKYVLSGDESYYIVEGVKSYAEAGEHIVIAPFYEGKPVKEIADEAFEHDGGLWHLKSVYIPNGIKKIGNAAFMFGSFSSIYIPQSVEEIGAACFAVVPLTSIEIDENNTSFRMLGNCLIDVTNKTLLYGLADITIPTDADIRRIEHLAFACNEQIENVIIPNGVESIGMMAFAECYSLREVVIPSSVTSVGEEAFAYCSSLASITVESGNTVYHSAGDCLIATESKTLVVGCKNSVIPTDGTVTSIGAYAFEGCSGLTSVTIGNSVTSIGYSAFQSCRGLTSITIPNSVESIGSYAFDNCSGLTSVTIGNNVTSIGNYAFIGCYKLIEVYNLSGLTITAWSSANGYVGCYAKDVYTSLESASKLRLTPDGYIVYSNDGTNEYYLMGYAGTETELTLPTDIDGNDYRIYQYAFCYRNDLTSVVISDGVTGIGNSAFSGCSGLTSVTIPDSVESISSSAFDNCSGLIQTEGGVDYVDKWVVDCDTSVTSVTLRADTVGIADFAFSYCRGLTSITIPNSVESIGDSAFDNCSGLTSVTIGNSVTSIGYSAFYGCYKLIEVYNLSGLTITAGSSGANGNVGCYAKDVYTSLESESKLSTTPDGYIVYSNDGTNEYYLMGYAGTETELTLPEDINGNDYRIYQYAFYYRNDLTSVVISDGVTSIGEWAFYNCSGLTSVTIGSGITSFDGSVFYGCNQLIQKENGVSYLGNWVIDCEDSVTSVTLRADTVGIADFAFSYCRGLTSITIPNSVESIGSSAFSGCDGLTSVTIGNNVTSIGSSAFYGCYKLIEVYNLSGLTITAGSSGANGGIGYYAKDVYTSLESASKLSLTPDGYIVYSNDGTNEYYLMGYAGTETELTLPEDINGNDYRIYQYAFYYRNDLTSVVIPDGVTSIGEWAFSYCSGLTSIIFKGTKAEWSTITKNSFWNNSTGEYTVYCTNGEISKAQS